MPADQITGLINPTSQLNGSVCSSGEILKSDGTNFSCESLSTIATQVPASGITSGIIGSRVILPPGQVGLGALNPLTTISSSQISDSIGLNQLLGGALPSQIELSSLSQLPSPLDGTSCSEDQILQWSGSGWVCVNQIIGLTSVSAGDVLAGTFSSGVLLQANQITGLINPTSQLNGSVCSSGEILKSDGTNFSCESLSTIATQVPASGITLGTIGSGVTLPPGQVGSGALNQDTTISSSQISDSISLNQLAGGVLPSQIELSSLSQLPSPLDGTSCSEDQILQWSGSGWACAFPSKSGASSINDLSDASYSGTSLGLGLSTLSDSTGFGNTAVGVSALKGNTRGYGNIALGHSALLLNTTGNYNIASGLWALSSNTTGSENTALGSFALYRNTTGSENTAIGRGAFFNNISGRQNTALGTNAGFSLMFQQSTIAAAHENVFFGYRAGFNLRSGSKNILIGSRAGHNLNGDSNNNIIIGSVEASSNTDSNTLNIGNLLYGTYLSTGSIASTGNIGIGTSNPTEVLTVDNGLTIGTYETTGWMHSSDRRFKRDIVSLDALESLEKILDLNPVGYTFKKDNANKKQIGFIAQDVKPLFNEVVSSDKNTGFLRMAYSNLIAPLVSAFQKLYEMVVSNLKTNKLQNAQIKELKLKNENLEKELIQIKKMLKKLELRE